MTQGFLRAMGWEQYRPGIDSHHHDPGDDASGAAARRAEERLGIKALRVIGDPTTKVVKVAFMPGYGQLPALMRSLAEADLVFTGEQREWEGLVLRPRRRGIGQSQGRDRARTRRVGGTGNGDLRRVAEDLHHAGSD